MTKYKQDRQYKLAIHLLTSLAYLPAEEIIEAYEEIAEEFEDTLGSFIDYFV